MTDLQHAVEPFCHPRYVKYPHTFTRLSQLRAVDSQPSINPHASRAYCRRDPFNLCLWRFSVISHLWATPPFYCNLRCDVWLQRLRGLKT